MRVLVLCIFSTFLCSSYLSAQTYYFPPATGTQWDTVSISRFGWNSAAIDPLYSLLDSSHTRAFLILKDGKIAIEKYFGTFTKDSLWYWASAGKTMTSVLVGIARSEGFLSLSDTSSKWLGKGWTSESPEKESRITVRHQLTMTAGLDDDVPDKDCTLSSCLLYKADAGTRWAYHNAPYTLLDSVIQRSTGMSLNQFYLTRIRSKIGMNGLYLRSDDYNNVLYTTPRSMARFGLLILNRGVWGSAVVLNDTAYFNAMVNTSQNINPSYGYLWWLNGKSTYMLPGMQLVFPGYLTPTAPKDMIAALGKNGQLINVVPSLGLVFVRMGDAPDNSLVPTTLNTQIWERLAKVIETATHAATQTSCDLPERSGLFQNYPNPFNPSTMIEYRLEASGHALLKVHDMLGREIATLVNEIKGPGTYQVQFNAQQYHTSSGIYLYTLDVAGLVQTKRMIVVK
ncbi:MAG: serine hydrolase [Ignavibacteriales bacterium]|nr:serine hydrolase [Ignavibacteriales bacterium]